MGAAGFEEAERRWIAAVEAKAAQCSGRPLPLGTTVVGSPERVGSTVASAYPLPGRTIIWCAPGLVSRLASFDQPEPITITEFVERAEALGGTFGGSGNNRVLTSAPYTPPHPGFEIVDLDPTGAADLERIAAFIDGCSEDDLDEAELMLDELDAVSLAVVDHDGAIAAYASARPWELDPDFDDIAVISHPRYRGLQLGAVAVSEFAKRRGQDGRLMFYNCNVDNRGSNRVAETVGFRLVTTISVASFD